jgi:hypothetical protein
MVFVNLSKLYIDHANMVLAGSVKCLTGKELLKTRTKPTTVLQKRTRRNSRIFPDSKQIGMKRMVPG